MDQITAMVGSVGVPAAICFYCLTKMQSTIENNTKALLALAAKMGVNVNDQ